MESPLPAHRKPWTLAFLKKNYSVIPLFGIIGVALAGVSSFIVYASVFKSDVVFKRNQLMPHQRVDIGQRQKILTFKQKYGQEDPAVTQLKLDIAQSYVGAKKE